jgi:putative transcription factor
VDCSKHGTETWKEEAKPKAVLKPKGPRPPANILIKRVAGPTVDTTIEIVEDFHNRIREAREKLGLSHEELGKRLNQKVSLLKKLESGKMVPDNVLATKLEHSLRIKLIVPATEEKVSEAKIPKAPARELTLGDLIKLGEKSKGKKGESAERERS